MLLEKALFDHKVTTRSRPPNMHLNLFCRARKPFRQFSLSRKLLAKGLTKKKPLVFQFFHDLILKIIDQFQCPSSRHYFTPKIVKAVGIISCYRKVVPTNLKILIYRSIFYSLLNYSNLVWVLPVPLTLNVYFLCKKNCRAFMHSFEAQTYKNITSEI